MWDSSGGAAVGGGGGVGWSVGSLGLVQRKRGRREHSRAGKLEMHMRQQKKLPRGQEKRGGWGGGVCGGGGGGG